MDPVNRRSWIVRGLGRRDLRNNSFTEPRDLQSSSHQDFIGPKTRSPSNSPLSLSTMTTSPPITM